MGNKQQKLLAPLLLGVFTLGIALFSATADLYAAVTTPTTINYQGRLLSAGNVPLSGNYTFRFSMWNTSDWVAGDTTGGGAVNVGSAGYAGWQETHAVTIGATDYGLFNMNLGDTTLFPSFNSTTHTNLQVEVKVTGALDTTYEILDPAGTLADATDRKPIQNQAFAQNADTLDNLEPASMLRSDANSAVTTGNTLTLNAGATLTGNGTVNLSGSTGNRLRESSSPNTLAACATLNEVIVDTTAKDIKICTTTGVAGVAVWTSPSQAIATGAANPGTCSVGQLFFNTTSATLQVCTAINTWGTAGPQDLESIYAKDADKVLTTGNNTFTVNAGTSSVTLNGQTGVNLNTAVNGPVGIGNGTSTVGIASSSWNISTAGVGSGFTGLTSTGGINFSGSGSFRIRENANPNLAAACSSLGELIMNTGTNTLMYCTGIGAPGTWANVAAAGGADTFETVYGTDADKILTTSNGAFTIAAGSGAVNVNSTNANGVNLNNNINGNVNIGTGTSTGTVSIGGGNGTAQISTSDWGIDSTGNMTGISGITNDSIFTTSGGAVSINNNSGASTVKIGTGTSTGAVTIGGTGTQTIAVGNGAGNKTVNVGSSTGTSITTILSGSGMTWINDSNDQDTNINTGTSAGTVYIGGGSSPVAINSTSWDISTAGLASGFTGITSTGKVNFSGSNGFRVREIGVLVNPGTICTNVGELIMETSTFTLYTCIDAGTDTWQITGTGADAGTLDTIDSTQFLRSDTSDAYTSGTLTFNNGTTLTVNGVANIGDGGDAIAVNSSTWDINSAGVASGFTGLTSSGVVDFSGATRMAMQSGIGNPGTCTEGDLFYNTTDNLTYACTAVNTWTKIGSGANDFEAVFTTDVDKTLTTGNTDFTVNTGTGDFIVTTGVGGDLIVDGVPFANMPFSNLATRAKAQSFKVEYEGATLYPDGTNNKGQMTVENEAGTLRNYYKWTTQQVTLQDMDVALSFKLPLDFVSFTGAPISVAYKTIDGNVANNRVDITMFDNVGGAVGLTGASGLANAAWTTANITFSGAPVFVAGDTITFKLKLSALNTGFAQISDIVLNYNGR